mgnify:CR=1 FL=1
MVAKEFTAARGFGIDRWMGVILVTFPHLTTEGDVKIRKRMGSLSFNMTRQSSPSQARASDVGRSLMAPCMKEA